MGSVGFYPYTAIIAAARLSIHLLTKRQANQFGTSIMANANQAKFDAKEDFPDFSKHNNWMAKVLTKNPDMYQKYRDVKTPNGYTFDQCIQTGVDNPGHPFIMTVGCVAGDEETYDTFKDFMDEVIDLRHGGYPADGKHQTDLKRPTTHSKTSWMKSLTCVMEDTQQMESIKRI